MRYASGRSPIARRTRAEKIRRIAIRNPRVAVIVITRRVSVPPRAAAERAPGDAAVVENGCVHQHFNDGKEDQFVLVMKAKPLFLFMHMLFQKVSEWPTKEATPKQAAYRPPADL